MEIEARHPLRGGWKFPRDCYLESVSSMEETTWDSHTRPLRLYKYCGYRRNILLTIWCRYRTYLQCSYIIFVMLIVISQIHAY